MCFSAEADIAIGVAVGAIGIDGLRHVSRPAQWPLAALPMVFAVHQLNEAVVWWGLDGPLSTALAQRAAWSYLFIAFALPVLVPAAVSLVEPDLTRRRIMWALTALGAFVSIVLVGALARGGATAEIAELHIAYGVDVSRGVELTMLYVVATCGAFLASSDRRIATLGAMNLAAVGLLAWLLANGVISLWCAWAAVASVLINIYLRRSPDPEPQLRSAFATP